MLFCDALFASAAFFLLITCNGGPTNRARTWLRSANGLVRPTLAYGFTKALKRMYRDRATFEAFAAYSSGTGSCNLRRQV